MHTQFESLKACMEANKAVFAPLMPDMEPPAEGAGAQQGQQGEQKQQQ